MGIEVTETKPAEVFSVVLRGKGRVKCEALLTLPTEREKAVEAARLMNGALVAIGANEYEVTVGNPPKAKPAAAKKPAKKKAAKK